MSKFKVGDKVMVSSVYDKKGIMTGHMREWFGGKKTTVKAVDGDYGPENECNYYILEIAPEFYFNDYDLVLVEEAKPITQHIEIPVPGGHLVAETTGGGDYPAIHIFFVASGSTVEHDLCFAEVCATDNPNVIRVGTYFRDCDEVQNIFDYSMWTKEEDDV